MFGSATVFFALQCNAEPLSLTIRESWSDVFAGTDTVFHAVIRSRDQFNGRIGWRLVSSGGTIARGENAIAIGSGSSETAELRMTIPPLNEGMAMQATLAVAANEGSAEKEVASIEKPLWIFSTNAFAGKTDWAKGLDIRLFDPLKKTAGILADSGIPFTEQNNIDALADLKTGMLIVGEGVSFKDYRGLSVALFKAASAGVPVLCLAPAGGEIFVPGMGSTETPKPTGISLRRQDIIGQLDKRLDAESWPPDGKTAISSIALVGERGIVTGQVAGGDDGWPWLEISFGKGADETHRQARGKVVICGFGIVEKWDGGPAPRFLLARLLEYMDQQSRNQEPRTTDYTDNTDRKK